MPSFSSSTAHRKAFRLFACFGAIAASFFSGCASPGPPRPPSLNLPQIVADLASERSGDKVILHWTTPAKTTDGLAIKAALTAKICRTILPTPKSVAATTPCTPTLRLPASPGASTTSDSLPDALTTDPIALITYRIEIENAVGHSAGPSLPAFAASGPTPAAIQGLRATTVAEGAMLEWSPSPAGAPSASFVELVRMNPALAAARQSNARPRASRPLQLAGQEDPEIHLRAKSTSLASSEPTGTVDRSAHFAETYRYTAQRVRTVQIGKYALELRSVMSAPVTLTLRDTFPPVTPAGLAAIPGTSPTQPSLDLSWEPNAESDLVGYNVYRRKASDAAPTRLTATPLPGPAFRDQTATPGVRYAYTITAIDNSGNESRPSSAVEEMLPQP